MALDDLTNTVNPSRIHNLKQIVAILIAFAIVPITNSITLDDTIYFKGAVVTVLTFLAFYVIRSDIRQSDTHLSFSSAIEKHRQYVSANIDFLEDLISEYETKLESSTGAMHTAYQEVVDNLNIRLNQVRLVFRSVIND